MSGVGVENDDICIERVCAGIRDFERFKLEETTFRNQYANIYTARLSALTGALRSRVREKWGNRRILQLTDLSDVEDQDELVAVIGTLYKHQELKPSILQELSNELQLIPQPARSNYSSVKDQVFLEDEMLRVKLVGDRVDPKELVTGLVCAVLGRELDDGSFWVQDVLFPGICPRTSTSRGSSSQSNGRILLVSGLDLVNTPDSMHFELLTEFVTGMAGNPAAQREQAAISLVVIAGNSVRGAVETYTHKGYSDVRNQHKSAALEAAVASHRLDELLVQIVKNCCVLLLPGQFDPTNHSIPQQSLHPCILPMSSRFRSFHGGTNPWIGRIGDKIVAGSSGQPVDDIARVADLMNFSPLDWLERSLTWRHFAPTAPDTLPAYPYFDSDPFVMEHCPDVYFVGNMEVYATKLVTGDEGQVVRLISIPKFSKTQTAVVVDLDTLDTQPLYFGAS